MDRSTDDRMWGPGAFEPPSPGGSSASLGNPMEQVLYEVKRTIVGQDVLLERLAVALLARGHILV
jgi:MoxR-like ATPase